MRSHSRLLAIFMALSTISCSIKEKRVDCPCYLDITLLRQSEMEAEEDKAWYGVWSEGLCLGSGSMPWPRERASLVECKVRPKGMVDVIVSSTESGLAEVGSQMHELYVTRQEVDCSTETASLVMGRLDKKFCRLLIRLSEEAFEKRQGISLTVKGPYCGVTFPSLRPASGEFSFTTAFDESGEAMINLPPQAGPGLRVLTFMDGKTSSTLDLYALMKENLYNWESSSLADFSCVLTLNSITHAFEISDWNVVEIDEKTY